MTTLRNLLLTAISLIVLAIGYYFNKILWPPRLTASLASKACDDLIAGKSPSVVECHFSRNYDEARRKFLNLAARLKDKCRITSLPVDEKRGLFIDVAEIGTPRAEKVVMSVSGIHGVEGFAGSGIHVAILSELIRHPEKIDPRVTIILVHAFNPFGFKYLRRANENNVDLNRNGIYLTEPSKVANRDPNVAGYEDIHEVLNRARPFSLLDALRMWLFDIPHTLIKMGSYRSTKRALVTGTYTRIEGIYFGGLKAEKSYLLLREFLENGGYLSGRTRAAAIIDIHTGLGVKGVDTLMIDARSEDAIRRAFPNSHVEVQSRPEGVEDSGAASGYESVVGYLPETFASLFLNARPDMTKLLPLTQEFGTVSPFLVMFATNAENQDWFYGPPGRAFRREAKNEGHREGDDEDDDDDNNMERFLTKRWMKAAFFVDELDFMSSVLARGMDVFFRALTRVAE